MQHTELPPFPCVSWDVSHYAFNEPSQITGILQWQLCFSHLLLCVPAEAKLVHVMKMDLSRLTYCIWYNQTFESTEFYEMLMPILDFDASDQMTKTTWANCGTKDGPVTLCGPVQIETDFHAVITPPVHAAHYEITSWRTFNFCDGGTKSTVLFSVEKHISQNVWSQYWISPAWVRQIKWIPSRVIFPLCAPLDAFAPKLQQSYSKRLNTASQTIRVNVLPCLPKGFLIISWAFQFIK